MNKTMRIQLVIFGLFVVLPIFAMAGSHAEVEPATLGSMLDFTIAHPEFQDAVLAQMIDIGMLPLSKRINGFEYPSYIAPETWQKLRSLSNTVSSFEKTPSGALQAHAAQFLDGLLNTPAKVFGANRPGITAAFGTVNLPDIEAWANYMTLGSVDFSSPKDFVQMRLRLDKLFDSGKPILGKAGIEVLSDPRAGFVFGHKNVERIVVNSGSILADTVVSELKGQFESKLRVVAGIKQNQFREQNDVKTIAQDMRSDIKAAVRIGLLPPAKYSVRITWFTGGDANSAIDVTVKHAPQDRHAAIKAFLHDLGKQYNIARFIFKTGMTDWTLQHKDFFFSIYFEDPDENVQQPEWLLRRQSWL